LTAPETRPLVSRRWAITKNTMTGMVMVVKAAMT